MEGFNEDLTSSLARYIVRTHATVRQTAKAFGMSKSAVHKRMNCQLKYMHPGLYKDVREVMDYHQRVKHLRGGEATRQKYLSEKQH